MEWKLHNICPCFDLDFGLGRLRAVFGYSAEWQKVVNTGTTICTFLMVFIIQNSQNRDGMALPIKLDEIIRAVGSAKNSMIDLESLSQEELEILREKFALLAQNARKASTR